MKNNQENVYHHIGIYLYKVSILEKFVNLKQTKNEISKKLEQLRAMENNISIYFSPFFGKIYCKQITLKKNVTIYYKLLSRNEPL